MLLEESILGWKEYELELMRDRADNVVVICSIENLDPMGVHTGDSITVAPAMTLTDREYQRMRDLAIDVIRAVGVDTGGCNIQFAVDPADRPDHRHRDEPAGVALVSALASKATGFPIAKIAAKLAVGYTLDEIPNDITRETPASFEPSLDYVVVKIPRFAFEKFPGSDPELTTTMKSVGEAMALGRILRRGAAEGDALAGADPRRRSGPRPTRRAPRRTRSSWPARRTTAGCTRSSGRCGSAPPSSRCTRPPGSTRGSSTSCSRSSSCGPTLEAAPTLDEALLRRAKRLGCSDLQIAGVTRRAPSARCATLRHALGVRPVYKTVDTCAAEFAAQTPYHYSSYDEETEVAPSGRDKVIILGSGPNRIGQGIEFDYACVHASFALSRRRLRDRDGQLQPGDRLSTDYDTSDRLYFEPLTVEDVLEVVAAERARRGGRRPARRRRRAARRPDAAAARAGAQGLRRADRRHHARRRSTWPRTAAPSARSWSRPACPRPSSAPRRRTTRRARSPSGVGYPVLVRPSYVLGGRGMEIVYSDEMLVDYVDRSTLIGPDHPVLVDRFLEDAVEIDVDALYDGTELYLGRRDGAHRGGRHPLRRLGVRAAADHAGPGRPRSASAEHRGIAAGVGVRGLLNVQYALKDDVLYVLEANPRASRGPCRSSARRPRCRWPRPRPGSCSARRSPSCAPRGCCPATGDGAHAAATTRRSASRRRCCRSAGSAPAGLGIDTVLGPEMKSTGEVMGIDAAFGTAFAKCQAAAYGVAADQGPGLRQRRQPRQAGDDLPGEAAADLGFEILATEGTAGGAAPQRRRRPPSSASTATAPATTSCR